MKMSIYLFLFFFLLSIPLIGQNQMEISLLANKRTTFGKDYFHTLNHAKSTKSLGLRLGYALNNHFSFELKGQYTNRNFNNNYAGRCCCFGDCAFYSGEYNPNFYSRAFSLDALVRLQVLQIKKLGFLNKIGIQSIQLFTAMGLSQTKQIRDNREPFQDWDAYPAPDKTFQMAVVGEGGLRIGLFKHFFLDGRISASWLLKESQFYGHRLQRGPELGIGYQW